MKNKLSENDYENKIIDLERKKNQMLLETAEELFPADDEDSLRGFIPTEFKWVTLDEQKKRAKELSNKTKKKK